MRTEWQGDCFAADLPEITASLNEYPRLALPHPQTATVFYMHNGEMGGPYRARGYGTVESPPAHIDDLDIAWHLERKQKDAGTKVRLGRMAAVVAFTHENQDLEPYATRIITRDHYALDDRTEHNNRITVDTCRNLYAVSSMGDLQHLGDLGPRIEVKADDPDIVSQVVKSGNLGKLAYTIPDRSYEFVLLAMAKNSIPFMTFGQGMTETEVKFSLEGEEYSAGEVMELVKAFAEDDEQLALLLPGRPDIQRLRRFHLCRKDDEVVTAVETTSGRFSLKRKQDARVTEEGVLLRTTEASYSTDTSGAISRPSEYLAMYGLTKVVDFTKLQRMVFLSTRDKYGTCIRVTYDDCIASNGATLKQLELEFAGTRLAPASEQAVQSALAFTAQRLQAWCRKRNIRLLPTITSKADYFLQEPS